MMSLNKMLKSQSGFALPAALLLLLVLSAVAVGMIHMVQTETRVAGSDLDSTEAYYATEAGMEKMMADLSALFIARQAPSVDDILNLQSGQPGLAGVQYPEYTFTVPNVGGNPIAETRTIGAGQNEGLIASIIPMDLTVTGRGPAGSEVKMRRQVQVALIPVFQFGIFSDVDLAYHPGPGFDFGGRVHTNGNLFLASSSGSTLKFGSKVSAAGEIIRGEMINGKDTTSAGRTGNVKIPTEPNGCAGASPPSSKCRSLSMSEGSVLDGPETAENPNWTNISLSTYNGMLVNGRTGANRLEMPFVQDDIGAIEIIRRPEDGELPGSLLGRSRLYNQAQIRVLLNDDEIQLPGGVGVSLEMNEGPYYDGSQHGATNTAFAGSAAGLVGGYLVVEARQSDGSYSDVTSEWLDLGIARENPDAILRFQNLKDNDGDGTADVSNTAGNRALPSSFQPINIHDAREGEVRDNWYGSGGTSCAIGGVMSIIELDVDNLRRWLSNGIGTTGSATDYLSSNGYIFYFSDRRGQDADDAPGEYGFEDMINPEVQSGDPNSTLDDPEDVNGNGSLEVAGADTIGDAFGVVNDDPTLRLSNCKNSARQVRVSGPRHAIKLVNGRLGNLPTRPDGTGGFSVASENPVYVEGDYNADTGWGAGNHAPASIMADAVTMLSNNWEDWQSFHHPSYPGTFTVRRATQTWWRVAVASGKNIAFPLPTSWPANQHYGLDGGTHNFIRYLERWTGTTANYQGSMVSFFNSRNGTGIFKCCNSVYRAPVRNYDFDTDFLDPAKLPPGTPRFQDLVNLGVEQIFSPY